MNIVKKYLEKRKQENERREQEAFLNTRITLEDLFICELNNCKIEQVRQFLVTQTFEFESIRILKRFKSFDYDYIDPITKTKYKKDSDELIKNGDIVVGKTKTINLPKEILERQYLTIAEIIELNEKLNEK